MSSLPADGYRKKQTHAIAAVLAVLVVITMLSGWLSLGISIGAYSRGLGSQEALLLPRVMGGAMSIFQTADSLGGIREIIKNERIDSEIVSKLGIAWFGINCIKIIAMAAIFALLIFIYTMSIENKNSAFIGQLGGLLAFFAAVFFAIFTITLDSSISSIFSGTLKISNSSWVYLTMLISAISLAFITVRKNIIKGE
jgi:hypothetical protein